MFVLQPSRAASAEVTTYHNDNFRTGWNSAETLLTPALLAGGQFGLVAQVPLDEQIDAQPLFLPAQQIAGVLHDVVYIASENNTIYAIDAETGAVLLSQNYGTAVPYTSLPAQCINNSAVVGINSTPVIDPVAGLLYFIAYTVENGALTFRLHAVSVTTLADAMPSVIVSGQSTLSNGQPFPFMADYQRQRPALLLANNTIYAGFGSFCDGAPQISRGWLLGWNATTLAPLAANSLVNKKASSKYNFFLSSIWMSGYGLAADPAGNVYFATGNTDYSGTAYSKTMNLSQSVLKMLPDLSASAGFYSPTNHNLLDEQDNDLASGGVMVIPPQRPGSPNTAVANGKSDGMFLLNVDAFSTVSQNGEKLGVYPTGQCWCGPSYYTGPDGIGRVVNSAGTAISIYKVGTGAAPVLSRPMKSAVLPTGPDAGFFTSVSSNGQAPGTAIVWAVLRAAKDDTTNTLTLAAFDPGNKLAQLYSAPAGTWPYAFEANSNIVPVVAGGYVYVATYKQLSIFGMPATGGAPMALHSVVAPSTHRFGPAVYGSVSSAGPQSMVLQLRDGRTLNIDTSGLSRPINPATTATGATIMVRGSTRHPDGSLVATTILRVKNVPGKWPADQ